MGGSIVTRRAAVSSPGESQDTDTLLWLARLGLVELSSE
jgi:hypothetical protein